MEVGQEGEGGAKGMSGPFQTRGRVEIRVS